MIYFIHLLTQRSWCWNSAVKKIGHLFFRSEFSGQLEAPIRLGCLVCVLSLSACFWSWCNAGSSKRGMPLAAESESGDCVNRKHGDLVWTQSRRPKPRLRTWDPVARSTVDKSKKESDEGILLELKRFQSESRRKGRSDTCDQATQLNSTALTF